MSLHLNIVAFDVPYPPNYGGVIDVYYKLYWLHHKGVKIYLHCFQYGRAESPELEKLCEKVYYYKRKTGLLSALSGLPYTVASRRSKQLEENLLQNNYPILFEVLHTCYLLNDKRFEGRKKIYRHSNIEHDYYRELARSEKSFFKKKYLEIEAARLQKFEKIISFADLILSVNQKDTTYFRNNYPQVKSLYLPSFHVSDKISSVPGKGEYTLFHGNLGISENYQAALFLMETVFSKTNRQVVIAGLNPPGFLVEKISRHKNIKLVENPGEEQMQELLLNAHIHLLYSSQPTGLKLKLLNVLFKGRFVLLNNNMLSGTGLNNNTSLYVLEEAEDFCLALEKLFLLEFNNEHKSERENQLKAFNNALNAEKLIEELLQ